MESASQIIIITFQTLDVNILFIAMSLLSYIFKWNLFLSTKKTPAMESDTQFCREALKV